MFFLGAVLQREQSMECFSFHVRCFEKIIKQPTKLNYRLLKFVDAAFCKTYSMWRPLGMNESMVGKMKSTDVFAVVTLSVTGSYYYWNCKQVHVKAFILF